MGGAVCFNAEAAEETEDAEGIFGLTEEDKPYSRDTWLAEGAGFWWTA